MEMVTQEVWVRALIEVIMLALLGGIVLAILQALRIDALTALQLKHCGHRPRLATVHVAFSSGLLMVMLLVLLDLWQEVVQPGPSRQLDVDEALTSVVPGDTSMFFMGRRSYILVVASVLLATQVFMRDNTLFAVRTFWLVLVPGREIAFAEVLAADVLTSISGTLGEAAAALTTLAFGGEWKVMAALMMAAAGSLPYYLRVRQCLVQYGAESDKAARWYVAVNLCKYLSSFPVVLLKVAKGLLNHALGQPLGIFWALAAVTNTFYSLSWDLTMDWGLRFGDKRGIPCGLRETLLLGSAKWYYMAVLVNTALRLSWLANIWYPLSGRGMTLALALLEVARRAIWSILRIEWEVIQLGIVQHHHASPFPVKERKEVKIEA